MSIDRGKVPRPRITLPNSIHIPSSIKIDLLFFPQLFFINLFYFASWLKLIRLADHPWYLLVWLYAVVMFVPLIWRNEAPVAVFAIQWVLSAAAWPIMPFYTPVVTIPVALYAIAAHCSKKASLLALLTSFAADGLTATVAFRVNDDLAHQLYSFIPNIIFLVFLSIAAWGAGRVTQATQRHVEHLERDVQHLEQERETVRQAVVTERRRIAQELKGLVSDATGKKAMAELRRILEVLELSNPPSSTRGFNKFEPPPRQGALDRARRLAEKHPNRT